jgi:hypothetical protein
MKLNQALVVVAIAASPAMAVGQPATQPEPLRLPVGSRIRLQTSSTPGTWTKGVLTSADSSSVSLVPEDAPVLGENRLSLPTPSVSRLELRTGSKRHWLYGMLAGAVLGVAIGAAAGVDSATCDYDYSTEFCSRGEAIAAVGVSLGLVGAGVGALVKTDRWMPVAIDALGPPAPRVSGVTPRLRATPRGGVELALAFGF